MCGIFVCGFCRHVGRIVNYVTKVAAKSTGKKASEIGILINASSLTTRIKLYHSIKSQTHPEKNLLVLID